MGSYQHSYSQVSQYLQDDENGDFTIDASTPRVNESSCQLDQSRMVSRSTQRWITAFAIAVILSVAVVVRQYTRDDPTSNSTKNQNYNDDTSDHHSKLFDKFGRFIVEDFDVKPTFSDFLPGVAGVYGKPNWVFYVNRGQGIASFGTLSKDYPIMEFNSANKAYQLTSFVGFRTFLKGYRGKKKDKVFIAEPFSPDSSSFEVQSEATAASSTFHRFVTGGAKSFASCLPKREMYIGKSDMGIKEIDYTNNIETSVQYFSLAEEYFSSLVRLTSIKNTDKHEILTISALDGLAKMEPDGGNLNNLLKNMGRTLEGWMSVIHADNVTMTMPFYKMSTEPADSASIRVEEGGHYCLSYIEDDPLHFLPIVYDTDIVFGQDTTLLKPRGLMASSVKDMIERRQYGEAKTSSCFAAIDEFVLGPGEEVTIVSFYGKTENISQVPQIATTIASEGYAQKKLVASRNIIKSITDEVETRTNNGLFDGHVKQMFLDNSLRGGKPLILGDIEENMESCNADEDPRLKVYHTFSRIHGDLERDYNDFVLEPTYFSQPLLLNSSSYRNGSTCFYQGPGNFRDVLQNRRSDVIFQPRIASFDVKLFLSFIQADGYNPLTVEAIVLLVNNSTTADNLATRFVGNATGVRAQRDALFHVLDSGPIRPGQLFALMENQNIEINVSNEDFINAIAASSRYEPLGLFGAGFWADHWTYYLDLINAYLSIYPDGEEYLMFDVKVPYFYSPATVRPRHEKYVLSFTYDYKGKHVRQLDASNEDELKLKSQLDYLNSKSGLMTIDANWQHDLNNNRFLTSSIGKLFLLCTIKFATRDAYGMGIEYEAGRPGWNDAMNGLPGMVGSGMPEAYELKNLLKYVLSVIERFERSIVLPVELGDLIDKIDSALEELQGSGYEDGDLKSLPLDVPQDFFSYWNAVATAREDYRNSIAFNFSNKTRTIEASNLVQILTRWIKEVNTGLLRAIKIGSQGYGDDGSSGVTPTYFSYNITNWTLTGETNKDGYELVNATAMSVGTFPLFLEGPVRMMKTSTTSEEARIIYRNVLASGLRDDKLKMYSISASLEGQSFDMGRMMAFSPGWLENQSIWTHMSYKYYLELLRNGLYVEFFNEMRGGGMLPFMDPEVYGRSPMECSSFIASSAFPDPSRHGEGFLARLSGSTAEFLSVWVLMMVGPTPFFLEKKTKKLRMHLRPALPLWLFRRESGRDGGDLTIEFLLFGSINVTYHNPKQLDLFGVPPDRYVVTYSNETSTTIEESTIPTDIATDIRKVKPIKNIHAFF